MPSMNKEVHRKYQKKHYGQNKQYYKDKRAARKIVSRDMYFAFKQRLKCTLCEENDHVAIDLHHFDPKQKESLVWELISHGRSWLRIVSEIEKCIALCANCHRKVHNHEEWAKKLSIEHLIKLTDEERTGRISTLIHNSTDECSTHSRPISEIKE